MNRNDLITALLKVLSTRKEAVDATDTIFSSIQGALHMGEKVVITGFGSFHPFTTKVKRGRNPKTGDVLTIPPHPKVRFRPAKDFFKS